MRDEAMVSALPARHRLANQKTLTLAKLATEPLLLHPASPRPSCADQFLEMFHARGLQPRIALESSEVQTAIGLVASGLGYALVPKSVQGLHRAGVKYIPLSDKGLSTPIVMNHRRDDDSELTNSFREIVRSSR